MNINLKDKNILIIGAASGLGLSLLGEFLEEGSNVIAIDKNRDHLKILKKKYSNQLNNKLFLYPVDVREILEVRKFTNTFLKKFKKLDSLIFCAKSNLKKKNTEQNWNEIMDVLIKAPMLFIENLKSCIIKNKTSIINIGSTNSSFVSHQPLAYHVAKSGLNQLTKYYANILGKYYVRANVVEPGLIKTKKIKKKISNLNKILIPLQKPAEFKQICDLILFLSSEKSSYITGEIIRVDGGVTLSDHPNLVSKIIKNKI